MITRMTRNWWALVGQWLLALSGVASVAFGVLLVFEPQAGARAVIYLIGTYLLVFGALEIALGLRLRSLYQRLDVGPRAEGDCLARV